MSVRRYGEVDRERHEEEIDDYVRFESTFRRIPAPPWEYSRFDAQHIRRLVDSPDYHLGQLLDDHELLEFLFQRCRYDFQRLQLRCEEVLYDLTQIRRLLVDVVGEHDGQMLLLELLLERSECGRIVYTIDAFE